MGCGRTPRVAAAVFLVAATAAGCGISEAFGPPGPKDVVFAYVGATDLRVGDRLPFSVTVRVGGSLLPNAHVRMTVLDPSVLVMNATRDTLVGMRVGHTELELKLENSLLAGDAPDTIVTLRVQGGRPL